MAESFSSTTSTPISQLNPQLLGPATRSIRATVTLIWPYSSFNQNFTLRLAESDVRLRRANGEVRVSFQGSSARTVYEAGIGSGDEVRLSLEGVEWVKDGSYAVTPTRGIEWELKFTERLLLEIRHSESDKVTTVDIDHPPPRELEQAVISPVFPSTSSPPKSTASRSDLLQTEKNEWSSPAFIKRARLSYGSLMESNYDMFADEDGTVHGKGRKRPKFGRASGSWRYSSRSPSPEAEKADGEDAMDIVPGPVPKPKPLMLDEACQTTDLEYDAANSLGELSRQDVAAVGEPRIPTESRITGTMGESEPFGSPTTMAPPPRPQAVLESVPQFFQQQAVNQPSSSLLGSVPSDGPSLVSPLVSPSSGDSYEHAEAVTDWTKQPIISLEDPLPPAVQAAEPNDSGSKPFDMTYFDVSDQYGHWQNDVAAHDQGGNLVPSLTIDQSYPALNTENAIEVEMNSGPYIDNPLMTSPTYNDGHGFPTYTGGDQIHVVDYPEPEVEGEVEEQVSPQHENLFIPSAPISSHHSNIGLSRSQSAQSGPIDLTEESDEEEDSDEMDANTDIVRTQQFPSSGLVDGSDAEDEDADEDEDEGLYDEYGDTTSRPYEDEEMSEDELAEDDGVTEKYPHGYYEPNQATAGRLGRRSFQNESEDDEEVEGEYEEDDEEIEGEEEGDDEDGEDNDEDGENGAQSDGGFARAPRKIAEVIDILSSDEEDAAGSEDIAEEDEEVDSSEENSAEEEEDIERVHEIVEDQDEPGSDDDDNALSERNESIPSRQVSQADIRKDDAADTVEAAIEVTVEVEDKELVKEAIPSSLGFDGHQELEAEDIEMDGDLELVRETSPEKFFETELESNRPEMEQVRDFIPAILVDSITNDELGILVDEDKRSTSFDEEWHDAPDIPSEGQINYDQIVVEENTEKIATSVAAHGETISDMVAVEKNPTTIIVQDHRDVSEDVFYPVLPSTQYDGADDRTVGDDSLADDSQSGKVANGQLPTPDATQLVADRSEQGSFNFSDPVGIEVSFQPQAKEGSPERQSSEIAFLLPGSKKQTSADVVNVAVPQTPRRHMRTRSSASQQSPRTDRSSSVLMDDLISSQGRDASVELALDISAKAIPAPLETPRRHMRTRSSASLQSPTTDTSSFIMDDASTSQGYDASAQLALEALESPTKTDSHSVSTTALRMKLSRSLRTELQDLFTPLKNVRRHLDRRVDVLAIATTSTRPEEAIRAKNGPRHYLLRFNITDPTLTNAVTEVQVFRPFRDVLPAVKAGDGVLLRNFLAKSERGRGFPLRSSDEGCSWAVFQTSGAVEMRGAPVEFGDVEREHINGLKTWFESLDPAAREKLEKANEEKGVGVSPGKPSAKTH